MIFATGELGRLKENGLSSKGIAVKGGLMGGVSWVSFVADPAALMDSAAFLLALFFLAMACGRRLLYPVRRTGTTCYRFCLTEMQTWVDEC